VFGMADFRTGVAAILAGAAPLPSLIPAAEPGGARRATIRRDDHGDLVVEVQRKLGVDPTGNFAALTEAAVRTFQRNHGLVPDGIVGPKSWAELDLVT
jgi:peptidoglycan hydrolase-like protein with peptidoglycan-binding domain